ncbi:acyl-CoA dehydrogenase family protein [Halorarius litoreus]|uniref:acyl-CoA dehydrogenase family protein n=1 Tax=Halorarius litoreus TaxID=2962676 RepID=UPI0020CCDAED|nr:acyl-CoA dehydrogenase family protein [Halorarius litoreus]
MSTDPIDYGAYESGRDCNYWALDPTLQYEAERVYPDDEYEWAESVLSGYGEALGHTIADNSDRIDRHGPQLHTYNKDGEVQNYVEYHPDQFETERITYEEFGLTHDAFHAPPGRDEPVGFAHVLMMQTLLGYCDTGFACPASMTTGAAIVLDAFDDGSLDDYFQGLTSRDYDEHIEGAMFLTEKQGGSDVGANEVRAEPQDDGTYELYGEKWFCSNIDAQGALALARTPDAPEGTKGLSLFLVPRELPSGELNDALFRRLKDKLGTIAVPTGEIEYRGATGYLVGEEGQGFKAMAEMMNYERLTNATGAVGVMGRALLEAKVRAANREAFGERIDQYPLLRRDLVEMTADYEAAAVFSFEAARFYDQYKAEGETSDEAWKLMRLLVPIAKKETARKSVAVTSYAMEVLGGNGYVREHVTERLLRDAQVLPIWEGTSNILSLDLLRVLGKEQAHEALIPYVNELLDIDHPFLDDPVETVSERFTDLQTALVTLASEDDDYAQYHAKELASLTYDVVCAALLISEGQESLDDGDARKALVAKAFVDKQFGVENVRGITSGETFGDEWFDAIARYASVDPSELDAQPAPADD